MERGTRLDLARPFFLFPKMVGTQREDPTHYSLAINSTNIIDRMFASIPGWGLIQMNALGLSKGMVEGPTVDVDLSVLTCAFLRPPGKR